MPALSPYSYRSLSTLHCLSRSEPIDTFWTSRDSCARALRRSSLLLFLLLLRFLVGSSCHEGKTQNANFKGLQTSVTSRAPADLDLLINGRRPNVLLSSIVLDRTQAHTRSIAERGTRGSARFTQAGSSRIEGCSHRGEQAGRSRGRGVISPHNSEGASKLLINQNLCF